MTDDRYKKIMADLGMPNSRSLLQALQQVASEVEQEVRASIAAQAGWKPIETAPDDGRRALVYRPLAERSGDQTIAIKRLIGGGTGCWKDTVPAGSTPTNPTDGFCHATHWMPIPAAPVAAAA